MQCFYCSLLCYSHTQPDHEMDLLRVKMGWNSPGIYGNLNAVRVETARYGFYTSVFRRDVLWYSVVRSVRLSVLLSVCPDLVGKIETEP